MNSIVDELISGRFDGSPYDLVTGSNKNSSGTILNKFIYVSRQFNLYCNIILKVQSLYINIFF